jgi:hypothetical protein
MHWLRKFRVFAPACSIAILVGIMVALLPRVPSSTPSVTKGTLRILQSALAQLRHRTGRRPASMWRFLRDYQSMYAYRRVGRFGSAWRQRPNLVTKLTSSLVVAGRLPSPDGTNDLPGVVEVLDTYGYPIQYMPPRSAGPPTVYPYRGERLPSWVRKSRPTLVYVPNGATTAMPPQYSHTPYFYSFGPGGPQAPGTVGGAAGYVRSREGSNK